MRTDGTSRYVLGGLGVLLIGIGVRLVVAEPDPAGVLLWLAGALVLHDGILAPLVLAVGLLLVGRRRRGTLRGALVVAGCLVLVTLPLLVRPGAPPNPSALPLPYGRNLAIVLAVVAAGATARVLVQRRRERAQRDGADGRDGGDGGDGRGSGGGGDGGEDADDRRDGDD
ncbi:hypothetical protein [Streptomyces hydrogenans]|uniref:hypothetical protein n=1 Tax=Streptomyces hydrogenans TaxID=1873719 RepID=UPI0035D5B172